MRQTLIHLFSIAFMVVGLFLFAACGPDEPEEEVLPRIEVEPAELLFTSDGGTESIALSANCSWSIDVPSDSFLTLSPTSGQGNTTVRVLVPPSDDVEARGVMFHINGVLDDKVAMTKLTVKQQGHPGEVSFKDVKLYNIAGDTRVREIPPEGGFVTYTVVANYEWFFTTEPLELHSLMDHQWEGEWDSYTWFPANVSGQEIKHILALSCFDEFGGMTDTLKLVQPPLEGSISLVSITPSSDGKTIPATGAKMILKVQSNSDWVIRYDPDIYWPFDPAAEHLRPNGGGPVSAQQVIVPVPSIEGPEGRTIRFWLLLNNLTFETGAIEIVQQGN